MSDTTSPGLSELQRVMLDAMFSPQEHALTLQLDAAREAYLITNDPARRSRLAHDVRVLETACATMRKTRRALA